MSWNILLVWISFQPFKYVKAFLDSWSTQRQVEDRVWPPPALCPLVLSGTVLCVSGRGLQATLLSVAWMGTELPGSGESAAGCRIITAQPNH